MGDYGIVEYFGLQRSYCGKCKNPDPDSGRLSHGMWLHVSTVQDYQRLLDRGWRRVGQYCHKPQMKTTCCPQYTIRCDTDAFKPSRSQKRVLKRFRRFVVDGTFGHHSKSPAKTAEKKDLFGPLERRIVVPRSATQWNGLPQCRNKNQMPREQLTARLPANEIIHRQPQIGRSLEDLIRIERSDADAHKFEIQLVEISNEENSKFEGTFAEVHALYVKYQTAIHGDSLDRLTEDQYRRYLCSPPFQPAAPPFGAFHQHYRIDGQLIAVAVIDILPNCVSAKYLFYDPDYSFLSLGIFTALHEISMVRQLREAVASLKYYTMGLYIHGCPMMAYKARFASSYLLCPETYTFHPMADCLAKLDVAKYARFASSDIADDEEAIVDLDRVLVLYRHQPATYAYYKWKSNQTVDDPTVLEYASLVGCTTAYQMLLCRE